MAKPDRHQAPAAMHGSTKSGYTEQIMPGRADTGMGSAIPVGSVSGAQEGRIPPARRDYSKARYDVVTLEEAQERMIKRMKGKLPPIKGGLDDDSAQAPRARKQAQARPQPAQDFDPLGSGDMQDFEPEADDQEPLQDRIRARIDMQKRMPAQGTACAVCGIVKPTPIRNDEMGGYVCLTCVDRELQRLQDNQGEESTTSYLAKRSRLTLELPDTTLFVNAVDAIVSKMGVTLLLPTQGEGGTFVPKAGSEVTITLPDGRGFKCYFPGVTFALDALKLLGLVFIRAEEE